MRKINWLVLLLSVSSPTILLVNFLSVQIPLIQAVASVLFIGASSVMVGQIFFRQESSSLKAVLGFAALLVLLSLIGAVFIMLGRFSEVSSFVMLIAVGVFLDIAFIRRIGESSKEVAERSSKGDHGKIDVDSILLSLAYLIVVALAFRLLWVSRTGEGGFSVWLRIPDAFTVLFLASSLALSFVLFFTRLSVTLKLGLVSLHSFLSHSLYLLVWYPGRHGDPWAHLGATRFIDRTGMPYAYSWILQNSLWVDLLKNKSHYAIVVLFERMFSVDIYWVYVVLVPVLWSVCVPIFTFKIAEALTPKKSTIFPLVAAMTTSIFPSLIGWGAVSVPNSFGFILFLFSVALLFMWMNEAGKQVWFLALLAAVTSFSAHPQTGIFAFMFLLFSSVLKKTSRKILWLITLVLIFSVYPLALYVYGASFTPLELLQVSNFLTFQSEISTILLVFGLVGLVLGIRVGGNVKTKLTLMLFVFYVVTLLEYYLTGFGMVNLPFGPSRVLVIAVFMLAPLVALGLTNLVAPLKKAFSGKNENVSLNLFSRKLSLNVDTSSLGFLLIALLLSLQATSVLYEAYPLKDIVDYQPSAYEVEAIQFIDSISPGRYVVLCDPGFANLAIGFLGLDYGWAGGDRGLFGIPTAQAYQGQRYPTIQMYYEMTRNPSIGILEQAMDFAHSELSYFVVSVRDPNFDEVIYRTLDILPANRVFGNGKLYVFKYPLQVSEEPGSMVTVVFDDGSGGEQSVQTNYSYMVESEINSTLTVTGYTSYNVTEFPSHWTFLELRVNNESRQFDDTSDINQFVYVKDLQPSDVLTITWLFNRHYPNVGWKEDSFKTLDSWRPHVLYPGTMVPTITSDGKTLSMSYTFTSGSYWYYYYTTSLSISTSDYPYLLMRWRSDQPVAIATAYFETGGSYAIVPLGSMSSEWSTIVVPLPPDAVINKIMVGLSNAKYAPDYAFSNTGTMEIDYILFGARSTP